MDLINKISPFFRKSKVFEVDGREYEYFSHGYNSTRHNERCVEVPFVVDFLSDYKGKDILDIPALIKYDCIVSISTIEHVGNYGPDVDPKQAVKAIKYIKSLLKPGGAFVCTIPVGFHKSLHFDFVDLFDDVFCLRRVNFSNEWVECSFDEVKDVKYSDPYNGAGAVLFGVFFND